MEEVNLRILITGAEGNLGGALVAELSGRFEVLGTDISDLDITEIDKVKKVFKDFLPQIVIHTAAETNVDGCEIDSEKAFKVNGSGTRNIAEAVKKTNTVMFYISTDYIFNGEKKLPYKENDKPNPINTYGKSKLQGEKIIQDILDRYFIIRSSWLFGKGRKTFVEKIIEKSKKQKNINIVDPKYATPTYANDLAKAISKIVNFYSKNSNNADLFGIYHITNSGFCSWIEYAQKILEYSDINDVKLVPVTQEQFGCKAKRPVYSVLDTSKYTTIFQDRLRPWQDALKEYLCTAN